MKEHKSLLASAARTATNTTYHTLGSSGGHFIIDCTVDPAAASITFTVQGIDATSGKAYTILASAAVAAVGTTVLTIFPGAAETANVSANDFLPQTIALVATHADADSMTYSVAFNGFN